MTEDERNQTAANMTQFDKMIMMDLATQESNTVNENMSKDIIQEESNKTLVGNFIGPGDGVHNAEGVAKVIELPDGTSILRLENLKATNGPDLYVYLSTDTTSSDIVNLGRLKGNIGNQNYEIPTGTDLTKYNTVLIWCQAFSVLFGSSELSPQ